MDVTVGLINTMAVVAATVVLTWFLHGRFEGVEKRISGVEDRLESVRLELGAEIGYLRSDLTAQIGSVRSDLTAQIGSVRSDLSAARSDLTAVALAVGARPRSAGSQR